MDDPSAIYVAIHDKEKELKALRENGDLRKDMGAMNELLSGVRKLYRVLVVNFPAYARDRKDIIGQLWKTCFYKQIEDFRRAIKTAKTKHDSLIRGPSPAALQDIRRHLSSLSHEFLLFLSDCIRYFQKLMGELESRVSKSDNNDAVLFEFITSNVHRCLLYLGDLSRYKELYAEKESKDFVESVRFYERAALIMPTSGNAHNQLAMLATYNEAESTALYHYCRSVMAKVPFSGGFENLSSLFEKNVQITERLSQELKQAPPELQARKNNDIFRLKSFLSSFVRLHGLFFAWSVRMHLEFIKKLDSTTSQVSDTTTLLSKLNTSMARDVLHNMNSNNNDINLERLHDLSQSLLEDFDMLLTSGNRLSDLYLLRLMTVCIFSVHFAELPSEDLLNDSASFSSFLQQSSASNSQQQQEEVDIGATKPSRSLIQSVALSLVFGLVNRACLKIINYDDGNNNASSKRALVDKMMPMLTVFSLWLAQHPQYLLASEEVEAPVEDLALPAVFQDSMSLDTSLSSSIWKRKYCVHREQARNETRVRSSLRTALSLLHEHFAEDPMFHRGGGGAGKPNAKAGSANNFPLLREFAEMRGYLPLQDALEKRFVGFHPLKNTMSWLPEQTARKERQALITSFIVDHILEPAAIMDRREASSSDVNVSGGGRTRQLFQVETGRKTERDRSDRKQQRSTTNVAAAVANSASNIAAAKNAIENAKQKENAKKGAYAAAVIGTNVTKEKDKDKDHPEKKRAKGDNGKIRGPPALDPTISMQAVDTSADMIDDAENEEEEEVAMPGIFAAVEQDKKAGLQQQAVTAAPESFSFFAFDVGNKNDGLWSYSLEDDDAADMSFDQLNQSIAEATADHQQQPHTQVLSANTSMNQFHGNGGLFSTSHVNSESRLNELADNGDDDYEDEVVFRPVFPRASMEQSSPFVLSRHATPSVQKSTPEPDIFGAIGPATAEVAGLTSFGDSNNATTNNIWSKFGVGLGMNVDAAPLQTTTTMTTMSSTWDDTLLNSGGAALSGLSAAFPGSNQLSSSLPLSYWDAPLLSISALPSASNAALSGPPGLIPTSNSSLAGPPPGLKSAIAAPPPPGLGSERKVSRGEAFLSSLGNSQSNNWTT